MNPELARWIVWSSLAWLGLGLVFGIPFVLRGAGRIDPDAQQGSPGFRLLILPGVAVLWPLLLRRWLAGTPPREERSPHRRAASRAAQP